MQKSFSVFISYSHKDRGLREELEAHLSSLKRQNILSFWHDGDIVPGAKWEVQILEHLKTAQIILLLISADFVASDFCYSIEMKEAIARHDAGDAHVIPILLRPIDWRGTPFSKLKMLPTDARAVTKWPTHDDAFEDIVLGIRSALDHLTNESTSLPLECASDRSNGDMALKPEVHSPDQGEGDVRQVPFFPNKAQRNLSKLSASINADSVTSEKRYHPSGSENINTISPHRKRWHFSRRLIITILSLICFTLSSSLLSALLLLRPSWCPNTLCLPAQITTRGVHDTNLDVYFIALQSSSYVIPGNPESYSQNNLPEKIGAQCIDCKTKSVPYRVIIGVHSLQLGKYGILIERVNLRLVNISPIIHQIAVWTSSSLNYSSNIYNAIYNGQDEGDTILASYASPPYSYVELEPGEAEQLDIQASSRLRVDLQFQIQISYRITNQTQWHTLTIPTIFEVIFSDASNWHEYYLQNGHFEGVQ